MIDSGLATSSASSLSNCRGTSSGPMDLFPFRFLRRSQMWSSPTGGGSSFSQSSPCLCCLQPDSVAGALASENWGKKATEYLILLYITGNQFSCFLQRGPTFSLVFLLSLTYLRKLFLLPLMSLARFNSIRVLALLTSALAALTISLYSWQVTCPSFHLQ